MEYAIIIILFVAVVSMAVAEHYVRKGSSKIAHKPIFYSEISKVDFSEVELKATAVHIKEQTDKIKEAIDKMDYKTISKVLDHLRFDCHLNHRETFNLVHEAMPHIDLPEWEEICMICDDLDSRS